MQKLASAEALRAQRAGRRTGVRSTTGRVARLLARTPIRLYTAGGGFLFGQRLLMLEHTGRRSGLPRYVVLEVVDRVADGRYLVASGRGEAADWYRNIGAQPHVRVWVGRRRACPAVALPLARDEARRRLEAYRARRPWTWRLLRPLVSRLLGRPGSNDEDLVESLPLVELALSPLP